MRQTLVSSFVAVSACALFSPPSSADELAPPPIPITDRLFHLGDSAKPEWKEFTSVEPEKRNRLEIEFDCTSKAPQLTLELVAGDVEMVWRVRLNGDDLGALKRSPDRATQHFAVPRSALREGRNRLQIGTFQQGDDIYVGKAFLHERPIAEVLGYARVSVRVHDPDTGANLPCRLTIVKPVEKKDEKGRRKETEELVDFALVKPEEFAVRKGIAYTKNGLAQFDIPEGNYVLYATHGFEYGLAEARLELKRREETSIELELRREVDTTGLLAADTHVHTRTYSGHGDISVEERVLAIAGEGVEVAIATDHNHHTDYGPAREKAGLEGDFSSLIGNEVTTSWGHFNAFPQKKDAKPTDYDHSDWTQLVKAMRASSGVRVVILNHPRRTISTESMFDRVGLNSVSGESHRGPMDLGVDAVEVINGKTLEEDRMLTVKDWLGMLNRGNKVAAVAGSDSHAVDEVVGQARTYVVSSTDDPRKARIDELCDAFLAGRLLISLGLLAQVEVDGKFRPGDVATGVAPELDVKIKVQGPSWTRADSVVLYLNGLEARREKIEPSEKPVKLEATWRIPRPRHDAHLVLVASGPPVTAPYWPISGGEKRYLLAATNPIWLDVDGDGKFTPALEYASRIAQEHGFKGAAACAALREYDGSVAIQFASLARAEVRKDLQFAYEALLRDSDGRLAELLAGGDPVLKSMFDLYSSASPKLDVDTRTERDKTAERLKKEEEARKKRREEEAKQRPQGRRPGGGR